MSLAVELSGFPDVIRARMRQGCGSQPGRATVDCVIGGSFAGRWPDTTTLTMATDDVTLTWSDMRVIKSPRIRSGYMRLVLEDSRWKLRNSILGADFNQMDSSGILLTESQASVGQLASYLSSKTSLSFAAGTTVPTFAVPAAWRGVVASEGLDRYLHDAVCRVHYSPVTSQYSIWASGTGPYPTLSTRLFVPSPNRGIRNVIVKTAPTLYESELTATAVVEDGNGSIVNVADVNPSEYFSGFPSAGNDVLKRKLIEGAFRLWKVDAANRHLQNHRALSLLSGSNGARYMGARLKHADIAAQMQEHAVEMVQSIGHHDESGYKIYYSPSPFLESAGSGLKTTAKVVASYYLDGTGGLQRKTATRSIFASGEDRTFVMKWLRPIESDQSDVPLSQWNYHLGEVADALATSFAMNPHTVTLPGLAVTPPSGHIGAVEYYTTVRPTPNILTRIAMDFDANPGDLS